MSIPIVKYEITPNGKKTESEWADLWLVLGIIGFGFAVAGASYLLEKIIDHTNISTYKFRKCVRGTFLLTHFFY